MYSEMNKTFIIHTNLKVFVCISSVSGILLLYFVLVFIVLFLLYRLYFTWTIYLFENGHAKESARLLPLWVKL